ncbi:MAG TPA: tetratricopeptide repeat protein [Pirellulales bacterium]|jgi:Flp pilus assembly protein TadD|nr:tetratricopeptide repeat protein [Pirellulales bacterium]
MFSPKAARPRSNAFNAWCVCGGILLAVGIIYGQTLGHVLLEYDDNEFVTENPHVTAGVTVAGIRWALTEGPFGEWYPLAPLSHMLDCQLFGLNAWGHHLTNVLLHAAASIALFLVWWRMTDELWPSAFVAAIFAVHPQHVESVAWVAERKDVLSGLFFVLTLGAYLGYVRQGRSLNRFLLLAALFALGLLAKPMIVTLPPLLLLLDFWPLARFAPLIEAPAWTARIDRPGVQRLVLEKLPLVALAVGDGIMTLRTHAIDVQPLPWSVRIGNAPVACVNYIAGLFVPIDLAAYYPMPPGGQPLWKVAGASAILAAVTTAAVMWRRRYPYFFVGWFWYLGMLSPVVGLIDATDQAMADRYTYLPGIGLSIAITWGAVRLAADSRSRRRVLGACALSLVALMVGLAAWQTSFWRDDETLWRHALACTDSNYKSERGLADALAHHHQLDEAIPHYLRAQQHAVDGTPFVGLGLVYAEQGKIDEAITMYRQALVVEPKSYAAHTNLARLLARGGDFEGASEHFRRAIEISPHNASSHRDLAYVLLHQQKVAAARSEFEQAVELDPRDASARNDLASALAQISDFEGASRQLEVALSINPDYIQAHVNLARCLAARGQGGDAATHYRRALELDPGNAPVRRELDKLLGGGAPPAAQ